MAFKIGDQVEIIECPHNKQFVGCIGLITRIDNDSAPYLVKFSDDTFTFSSDEWLKFADFSEIESEIEEVQKWLSSR